MNGSRRQPWIFAAILVGAFYFFIGRTFAVPRDHVQAWRLAAWLLCAVAYSIHIWYEHSRLRHAPRSTALHVAMAVAFGGFALAFAGMMRSFATTSAIRPQWLLALVLFPAFTAIPASLVALVIATLASKRTPDREA